MSSFTGADLTTINSLLKDDYIDPIVEQLNSKTLLSHRIERTSEFTQGKRAFMPLHIGRNEGLGSRPEADNTTASDLPVAGSQSYSEAIYNMTYHYGSVQFSGPSVAAARNDEGAFARVVETELDGLVRDASRDMNRQMFGPKSGAMALVVTQPSGTDADGVTITAQQIVVDSRQFIRVGQVLNFYAAGTGSTQRNGDATVTAVAKLTTRPNYARVTLSGTISAVVATDLVVRKGNYRNEMFGLIDLINAANPANMPAASTSYVGQIDRSANEWWQTNEINHANAAFADTLFQDAIDLVDVEGDGDISIFVTDHTIFNAYGNSLLPDRRFQTEGSRFAKLDGGFDALYYDDVPVAKDRDCQYNTIWGLAEDRIKFLHMSDWDWMDRDGSVLSRVGGGSSKKDAYEATLFKYCEMTINDAKDHVRIYNVGTVV